MSDELLTNPQTDTPNRTPPRELFEREFLPHADALYNFGYHLTMDEDDANDLVQDTFMKAWRFIKSYQEGTNAKAWLFKILKNTFINEYRRKKLRPAEVDYEALTIKLSSSVAPKKSNTGSSGRPKRRWV